MQIIINQFNTSSPDCGPLESPVFSKSMFNSSITPISHPKVLAILEKRGVVYIFREMTFVLRLECRKDLIIGIFLVLKTLYISMNITYLEIFDVLNNFVCYVKENNS